eukprot:Amastigsp_a842849_40.p2 type:complete len:117 gc:universal Amastigsp_a842849_40:241-591(+)
MHRCKARETEGENCGNEEKPENVCPRLDDVAEQKRQQTEGCVAAKQRAVRNEQHEELVVPVAHAVVDPRAVVIHFQDADTADRAVVRAVRLERRTLAAVSELAVRSALKDDRADEL